MEIFRGKLHMKNILLSISMILILMTLNACGGGGEENLNQPPAKTTVALTINLTGTLPANTAIAGTDFTLTLPANVTPANTNGVVATGVVTLSGTFTGGIQTPPVFTAATANTPGTLEVILANPAYSGVTRVGEVATISLQLANGATPTAGSFGFNAVRVIDATLYNTISGMGATITNVTLQ
jgi:predicted small lipoprotein YifL